MAEPQKRKHSDVEESNVSLAPSSLTTAPVEAAPSLGSTAAAEEDSVRKVPKLASDGQAHANAQPLTEIDVRGRR